MANKRYVFILLLILSAAACEKSKAKILIIGDSISIGYTPFVKESLQDAADVYHNPGNAKHSGYGLDSIANWIGNEDWDIIHFNWGLWDLCYRHPDSEVQGNRDKVNGDLTYTLEEYSNNLKAIISKIKNKSDAKLVFATTSYVPANEAGRYLQDAIIYNDAANKIMRNNNIIIHDIYNYSLQVHKQFGKGSDDVHYTEEGYKMLSRAISTFLRKEIE